MPEIFDGWPEKYDRWFETPIGSLIKQVELELILDMLRPSRGDKILDAGCGTGIFTLDILSGGCRLTGLELSLPMLKKALKKTEGYPFAGVQGDMRNLPFADYAFDKVVSVTAIEFVEDAGVAIHEFFRVTKPGGRIVVATLNSLSPWAARRKRAGRKGHPIFSRTFFRSPARMRELSPVECTIQTAVHFNKDEDPDRARKIEAQGRIKSLSTGAFLAALWVKPEG